MNEQNNLVLQAKAAREAALDLAGVSTVTKNAALLNIAEGIKTNLHDIISENQKDLISAREKKLPASFIDRLMLNAGRADDIVDGLLKVSELHDPVGRIISTSTRENGLRIEKRSVPLGVIGIIYESRPNVTVDAAALCLKAGNAVILRGGSDAFLTNAALVRTIRAALQKTGLPEDCVSLVMDTSRETATALMRLNEYLDVLIPRGGGDLIRSVVTNATVPVIQTGEGNCHIYINEHAELPMAQAITVSAKISRPSVCNSAETLLVDESVARRFLPACLAELKEKGVEIRGCEKTRAYAPWAIAADDSDWRAEYNDLIYAVRIVAGLDEAIAHINKYGTRHSEAIITRDEAAATRFLAMVDAAAVYVNASTRFTDGFEFGFGAEIGISNQKLHARGPMGLDELTTYKYCIRGDGQLR